MLQAYCFQIDATVNPHRVIMGAFPVKQKGVSLPTASVCSNAWLTLHRSGAPGTV